MSNEITITISGAADAGCGVLASEIELYLKTLGLKAKWEFNPHSHPLTTEERAVALARHRPTIRIVKATESPQKQKRIRALIASLEGAKREDHEERGYSVLRRVAHGEIEDVSYVEFLTRCRDRNLSAFITQCHRWYDKKAKQ